MELEFQIKPQADVAGVQIEGKQLKETVYQGAEHFEQNLRGSETPPDAGGLIERVEEESVLELTFEQTQCAMAGLTHLANMRRDRAQTILESDLYSRLMDVSERFKTQKGYAKKPEGMRRMHIMIDGHLARANHLAAVKKALSLALDESLGIQN